MRIVGFIVVLCGGCIASSSCSPISTESGLSSCEDPPGTQSVVLEACYPNSCSRNNELDLESGFLGDSCKSGITDLSFLSQNLSVDGCNRANAGIVDVGTTCLAQVKETSTGLSKNVAATVGHRYVVRSLEGNSFAVSVDGYTQTVEGGIAGIRLRYVSLRSDLGLDAGSTATATATVNGNPMCPLGWTDGLQATATGSTVEVTGRCGPSDNFQLRYSPTPAPGGTAPTVGCAMRGPSGTVSCGIFSVGSNANGTMTLTGASPSFRVAGTCDCARDAGPETAHVTFDMPLVVQ